MGHARLGRKATQLVGGKGGAGGRVQGYRNKSKGSTELNNKVPQQVGDDSAAGTQQQARRRTRRRSSGALPALLGCRFVQQRNRLSHSGAWSGLGVGVDGGAAPRLHVDIEQRRIIS